MKAMINQDETYKKEFPGKVRFENQIMTEGVKIVDCELENDKGILVISLYSQLLTDNQIEVFMQGSKISILISEQLNLNTQAPLPKYNWQNFYPQSYTRLRNISILLPGNNFFLLKHRLISEKSLLKIFLGRLTDN